MSKISPSGATHRANRIPRVVWVLFGAFVLVAFSWFLFPIRGSSDLPDSRPSPDAMNSPPPNEVPVADSVREHLESQGLQMADHDLAARLFRDPRRNQELIVFVDARDGPHYESGHIPGAYQLEGSHVERDLPILFPICLTAESIVIYCSGGDCNDSESAALTLREIGVSGEKLFVYPGGIAKWQRQGLPMETGPRQSGNLRDNP